MQLFHVQCRIAILSLDTASVTLFSAPLPICYSDTRAELRLLLWLGLLGHLEVDWWKNMESRDSV